MKFLVSNRFSILFITLIGFVLIVPPVVEYSQSMTIVPWALSAIIGSILFATRGGRGRVKHKVLVGISIVAMVGLWSYHSLEGAHFLERADAIIFAVLLFSACFIVLRQLALAEHVNRETIAASLSAYLLFGMAMSRVFLLVYLIDPSAFFIAVPSSEFSAQPSFFYFSFVVLSTVGFGDITPASAIARSLMIIEAIFGVFYLTVVLSRLVSLYRKDDEDKFE